MLNKLWPKCDKCKYALSKFTTNGITEWYCPMCKETKRTIKWNETFWKDFVERLKNDRL